jgi:antitoxin PrlF
MLRAESTLNDQYRTTVPAIVRRALGIGKRDKIRYVVHPNGEVVLSGIRVDSEADPALEGFLALLNRDCAKHPERLRALDAAWVNRIQTLVQNVDVNLDDTLPDDDA